MFFWEQVDVESGKGWRSRYKEATLVAYPSVGLDVGLWYWAAWGKSERDVIRSGTAKDDRSAREKAEESVMRGCG
jgi:hypothetical protein